MTDFEIIEELYLVSKNMKRLEERIHALTKMLFERKQFVDYLNQARESLNEKTTTCEKNESPCADDETTDNPLVDMDNKHLVDMDNTFIRSLLNKCKNGKGLYAPSADKLLGEFKDALDELIEKNLIKKVLIGTNYYYVENF